MKNLRTFRPVKVAFHEYRAMWRDVRVAGSWRDRLGYVFGGPAWRPKGEGRGLAHLSAAPQGKESATV